MTKNDIIRMVREAGFVHWEYFPVDYQNKLERFAALVAAQEREACANVCDGRSTYSREGEWCAAAIRARSQQ